MRSVRKIAEEIIAREGGFVDDPDDPGGATKYGVSVHTMRRLGIDLDGDGMIDTTDVKLISKDLAADIFVRHYFVRPRLSELPNALQPSIFDMYVNAGDNAVRILQRLLRDFGFPVIVDGRLGPQSLQATTRAFSSAREYFVDAYGIARRNYYYALAERRPASRKYARSRDGGKGGWIRRAEEFVSPRYHLSDLEHRKKTMQWG